MKPVCRDFAIAFARQSLALQSAYDEAIDYWGPDEPPVTILFSVLGDQVADNFDKLEIDVSQKLFGRIEAAMASGDEELVTAVATGLIEAIVTKLAHDKDAMQRVLAMFGERSREHAEAWLSFGIEEVRHDQL